jgi:hypothetical protein
MSIKNAIKRLYSYFTSKRVDKGIGVSFDDTLTFKDEDHEAIIEKGFSTTGALYRQKDVPGSFIIVNVIRKDGVVLYQLKHRYSEETFNITRGMLDFFFMKY